MTVQDIFIYNMPIYVIVGIGIMGLLIRLMVQGIYKNLIKASENMANSENNLMKQVKTRFEACYKLKIGVHNVDIFVDKYIYKHKSCGILLCTWENISGQLFVMSLLVGIVSIGLAIFFECGQDAILSTFLAGLITNSLLIIVDSFIDLSRKRIILQVNMKDYLENMLQVKLEQMYFYPESLERYQNEYFEEEIPETIAITEQDSIHDMAACNESISNVIDEDIAEEDIIADILKEFLQ